MTRAATMKKMMIQFHATPEELVDYANSITSELGLFMAVMVLKPFALRKADGNLSVDELSINGDIRVFFATQKLSMDASSPNHFYDLNPAAIGLHIGRLSEQGLGESTLAYMSDDKASAVIASKVASRLKKLTRSGVIAVNPVNGIEGSVRSHRYTSGAKKLYDKGIKMLPVAGHVFFKLAD